jgi:hypothetical protein
MLGVRGLQYLLTLSIALTRILPLEALTNLRSARHLKEKVIIEPRTYAPGVVETSSTRVIDPLETSAYEEAATTQQTALTPQSDENTDTTTDVCPPETADSLFHCKDPNKIPDSVDITCDVTTCAWNLDSFTDSGPPSYCDIIDIKEPIELNKIPDFAEPCALWHIVIGGMATARPTEGMYGHRQCVRPFLIVR